VPDEGLVVRRAAGEPLRVLAGEYGVAHSTLVRWFGRAEVAARVRVERRALVAGRGEQRRLVAELRRRAREEAGRRAGRRSRADELAELAVCAGGGVEAVVEATRLRARETVFGLVDPAVVVRALENDRAVSAAGGRGRKRLRRLCPDQELLCRRAAGETLRVLAVDYGVAHTTLGRYFARPQVARRVRELRRRLPTVAAGEAGPDGVAGGGVAPGRRYRRLTGADLQLIADWHARGASDATIASELGCDRSSRLRPWYRRLRSGAPRNSGWQPTRRSVV
jgi:transposase-like protein